MLTDVLELQLLREGVVFERLLLDQTQSKVFIIHNTSLLPVKWRLAGADALPPEFKVLPSSGEIPPRQETAVTVEFTAIQKQDLSEKVTLQVSTPSHASASRCVSAVAFVLILAIEIAPGLIHFLSYLWPGSISACSPDQLSQQVCGRHEKCQIKGVAAPSCTTKLFPGSYQFMQYSLLPARAA